jgi:hypothetical protein
MRVEAKSLSKKESLLLGPGPSEWPVSTHATYEEALLELTKRVRVLSRLCPEKDARAMHRIDPVTEEVEILGGSS